MLPVEREREQTTVSKYGYAECQEECSTDRLSCLRDEECLTCAKDPDTRTGSSQRPYSPFGYPIRTNNVIGSQNIQSDCCVVSSTCRYVCFYLQTHLSGDLP